MIRRFVEKNSFRGRLLPGLEPPRQQGKGRFALPGKRLHFENPLTVRFEGVQEEGQSAVEKNRRKQDLPGVPDPQVNAVEGSPEFFVRKKTGEVSVSSISAPGRFFPACVRTRLFLNFSAAVT